MSDAFSHTSDRVDGFGVHGIAWSMHFVMQRADPVVIPMTW